MVLLHSSALMIISLQIIFGYRLYSGLEARDMISVNNVSSDDEGNEPPVILSTKGGTYKLRDSR